MNIQEKISKMHLVCPTCKGAIIAEDYKIICLSCGGEFSQKSDDFVNLMSSGEGTHENGEWEERQKEMTDWYQNLLPDLSSASSLFEHDYHPFKEYLSKLRGEVLDIGGGVGVVRHYLDENANYIVVDPSLDWLGSDWRLLAKTFPCLKQPPSFIYGKGEYLMFKDNSFDSVLSFWSINHVSHPSKVFDEVQRVLKPGGKFLVVFEDMEPRWSDFVGPSIHRQFKGEDHWNLISSKFKATFLKHKWPVQSDHLLITDKDIKRWIRFHFRQVGRAWKGTFLTCEFEKIK